MPLEATDHLAILDLIARYNHAIDFGTAQEYADCFTPDGEFDARPVVHARGRAELIEFATAVVAGGRSSLHWTSNASVEGDESEARSRVYLMNVRPGLDAACGPTGVYFDRVVKVDGSWRFGARRLVFDEPPSWRPAEGG
jgi:hypothetical protein